MGIAYKTRPVKKYRDTSAYQYETSPRKLQPEYKPKTKKKTVSSKPKAKSVPKYNHKPVAYIVVGFILLSIISYRNSLINETYNKKESLRTQLAEVQKENEQLKVNIESSLNLSTIEKIAKEQLGMQKLSNSQKVFVNLQKQDYVESAKDEVVLNDDESLFSKIFKTLSNIIK